MAYSCDSRIDGDGSTEFGGTVPGCVVPPLPAELELCEDLPRGKWVSKFVMLTDEQGKPVAEGICHSIDSELVIGCDGALGDDQVAVHITNSLDEVAIPTQWAFSMRVWHTKHVIFNSFSLHDHMKKDQHNKTLVASITRKRTGIRPYSSIARMPPVENASKATRLLSLASICAVASQICCKKNCVQPYPREKIKAVRNQLWSSSTFKFKDYMKLEIHRQFHDGNDGREMVTLKGIEICAKAWQLITAVPKSTFYRKRNEVLDGRRAQDHGNKGLLKPRRHVRQAAATLQCMLESAADHMPHKSKVLASGDKVVCKTLPASWKWKESIPKINAVNGQLGLRAILQSALSKIWRMKFSEYSRKALGDHFAWCTNCDEFDSMIKVSPPGSFGRSLWVFKLKEHLDFQKAHRELYYGNRSLSITRPLDVLTIIHDKMDHPKTASPLFSHKTKANDSWMKLPIAVTGMIAHGHGDVRYAHYGLDIYPSDSNHTVGSIAKLLRDLEDVLKSSSRLLFENSGSAPIFRAVLEDKEECYHSLPAPGSTSGMALPLPPILHVQLDNAASDNKNRYVFAFWSLLVARGIFCKVYVNFLLVGHTHEDIDALFGQWSMKLKESDYPTIPLLIKSFMDAESQLVIPHLIEEVPDFKDFIDDCIADGEEILVGHTKGQQFNFFLHESGWPLMQYKLKCTDSDWEPKDKPEIKLWKEDVNSMLSILPVGEPKPVAPIPMKNLEDITKGLGGFINQWEALCAEDVSGEYRRGHERLIRYWQALRATLNVPIFTPAMLRNGFWPRTRIVAAPGDQCADNGELQEAYATDPHFIGRKYDRPTPSFRVGRDVYAGYFLVVRPPSDDERPFWIARALTNFDDDRHYLSIWVMSTTIEGIIESLISIISGPSLEVPNDIFGLISSPPQPFELPSYIEARAQLLTEAPSPVSVVKKRRYHRDVRRYIDDEALVGSETSSSDHDGFLS